jgi:hypothetical protein
MKRCTKCKGLFATSNFYSSKNTRSGLQSWCKNCTKENTERNRKTVAGAEKRRATTHLRKYGITLEDREFLDAKQENRCAICKTSFAEVSSHLDHDHKCCPHAGSCGKCIRGLLCPTCNQAIGLMKDDPIRLIAAAEYLREWQNGR